MKKINVKELVELVERNLEIKFISKNLGEIYEAVKLNSESGFNGYLGYDDYASYGEGDCGLYILCGLEFSNRLCFLKGKEIISGDLELLTDEDTINGEEIKINFSRKNHFYLNGIDDLNDELLKLSKIAKDSEQEISVIFEDASNSDFEFKAEIHADGSITRKGSFVIKTENPNEFYYSTLRFLEQFRNSTIDAFEDIPFVLFIDGELTKEERDITGKDIIKEYLSGKRKNLFDNKETLIDMINKYPVIMSVALESVWKERDIVIAFIKANISIVNKEEKDFIEAEKVDEIVSSNIIKHKHKVDRDNAMFVGVPPYINDWLNDEEILNLVVSSQMIRYVSLTKDIYDEAFLEKILKNNPRLIYLIFAYWENNIEEDFKTSEHVKRKYNLNEKTSNNDLAGYKCYDLVSKFINKEDHLMYLSLSLDSWQFLHDIILELDENTREKLIKLRISLIQYIKNELNPNDKLVEYVIAVCPEPGAFLSDETILERKLTPYEKDKRELCNKCGLCDFVKARIR